MTTALTDALPVALDAIADGRCADALLVLTAALPLDQAIAELAPLHLPLVGDILVSSWGWDQTNIDYYQVVAVTKASVRIQKIRKARTDTRAQYTDEVVPLPDTFDGPTMLRRYRTAKNIDRAWYTISIEDYASASLWDGKPDQETASGHGH